MTFDEAIECDDITIAEAKHELRKHGMEWDEFTSEVGTKETYTGREVLEWLGY